MSSNKIERKLFYYKITTPEGDGVDGGLFGLKLAAICVDVNDADREFEFAGTYVNIELVPGYNDGDLIKGVVKQIRGTAPSKRKRGNVKTTPILLDAGEGIDESTHFIYSKSTSLLCIEYNYHGPKANLLIKMVNTQYKKHVDKEAPRNSHTYIQTGDAVRRVLASKFVAAVVAKPVDPKTAGVTNDESDLPDVIGAFRPPKESRIEYKFSAKSKGGFAMVMSESSRSSRVQPYKV